MEAWIVPWPGPVNCTITAALACSPGLSVPPAQRIAVALNALPRNLAVTVNEAIKANKFGSGGGGAAPAPETAQ